MENIEKYRISLLRHWQGLYEISRVLLGHIRDCHHLGYHKTIDGFLIHPDGRILTTGEALLEDVVNKDYLFENALNAYWSLFEETRNLKNEKLIAYVTRSLLEIFERRLCYLAYCPNPERRVRNYVFDSAHLFYDELELSRELVHEMIVRFPELHERSDEMLNSVRNGNKRDVMKKLEFSDRSFLRVSGFIANEELSKSKDLYAVYSLALHGDPFTVSAFNTEHRNDYHYLLPKTLQMSISCEVA